MGDGDGGLFGNISFLKICDPLSEIERTGLDCKRNSLSLVLVDRPALLTFRFPLDLRLKLMFNQIYLKLAV